ncbi:MAG: MFS transporter [Chloroflexi bacterium]|nr:MFS transporter [Chloroflexota bacterium]
MDPTLVLVAFLSNLTSSPILLGLVGPLRDGGWAIPQIWVSGYLQNQSKKIRLYQQTSYVRIGAWFLLFISINFVQDAHWLLITFFLAYGIAALASGLSGLSFLEVVGKTIPPTRRAEFFALRLGLGGLVGVGGSVLVRFLLDNQSPLKFPANFGVISTIYLVAGSASLLMFNTIHEERPSTILPKASLSAQLKRIPGILREDPNFRHFLSLQSMLTVAGSATPFFAVYVQQQLGGPKAMIGVYLTVYTATNLAMNLLFGKMSPKWGNRRIMLIAALAGLIMSSFVLLMVIFGSMIGLSGTQASYWLVPVFFLSGIRVTGIGVSGNSLLLDLAPVAKRSLYLGFSNSFTGAILLSTALSGLVIAIFGFPTLLVITLLAHGLATFSVLKMGEAIGGRENEVYPAIMEDNKE